MAKFHNDIIPGTIQAEMNGRFYKVKEKIKGNWDENGKVIRFDVIAINILHLPHFGILNIKYERRGD